MWQLLVRLTLQVLASRVGWPISMLHTDAAGRRPLKVAQLVRLAAGDEAAPIIEQTEASAEWRAQVLLFLAHLDSSDEI